MADMGMAAASRSLRVCWRRVARLAAISAFAFAVLEWHPRDDRVAEVAGALGRRWLPSNRGIDSADLAIAATAMILDASLLTRNAKHLPMFEGLAAPH